MYNYPITRYMGFAIIILAILDTYNVTHFKPLYLLGFSFSALLLTFVDLLEFKASEKNDPFKFRRFKLIVLFLAICFFIIVPNLSVPVSEGILNKLNNIAVLVSIGLLFVIIGYKQEKVMNDSLISTVENMIETALKENLRGATQQVVDEMFEEKKLSETIKKTIDKIENERS